MLAPGEGSYRGLPQLTPNFPDGSSRNRGERAFSGSRTRPASVVPSSRRGRGRPDRRAKRLRCGRVPRRLPAASHDLFLLIALDTELDLAAGSSRKGVGCIYSIFPADRPGIGHAAESLHPTGPDLRRLRRTDSDSLSAGCHRSVSLQPATTGWHPLQPELAVWHMCGRRLSRCSNRQQQVPICRHF